MIGQPGLNRDSCSRSDRDAGRHESCGTNNSVAREREYQVNRFTVGQILN